MVVEGIGTPTLAARMLGVTGVVVTAAAEYGEELELVVETTETVTGCPRCGVVATAHGRRPTWVRDMPSRGRPVMLCWHKRIWRCDVRGCRKRTWSERSEAIAPRAVLTERARVWATRRVGADGDTVAAVAAELSVGWHTVMRGPRSRHAADRRSRTAGRGERGGVDEHAWQQANPRRRTRYMSPASWTCPQAEPADTPLVESRRYSRPGHHDCPGQLPNGDCRTIPIEGAVC